MAVTQSTLQMNEAQTAQVIGPITFATTPDLWQQGNKLIKHNTTLTFDLSQVTTIDSSSLSLLIGWIKQANTVNHSIKFLHVPARLDRIAKLSGFDQVIAQWTN